MARVIMFCSRKRNGVQCPDSSDPQPRILGGMLPALRVLFSAGSEEFNAFYIGASSYSGRHAANIVHS